MTWTRTRYFLLGLLLVLGAAGNIQADDRPNIVWIMAEDIGCDLACYDTPALQTPNLDGLAAAGLRLNRAYCTSPICSTNRSAMMTGMYQTSIGAHHHRSHREDGYVLPKPVRPITAYLKDAGYFCAVGCGYGAKTDLNFKLAEPDRPLFNGQDWSEREPDQPFFAQIQLNVTHRGKWWEKTRRQSTDPVNPAEVKLPPYLPDHPKIREDWATYLDQVERADAQVGEILTRLKEENLADRTVVIFIGDNGRCVHRGKGFLFEDGIKVPCLIRWPGRLEAGVVSEELVSMIDVSAQILAIAGIAVPEYLQGRPFLEYSARERDYVFAARDRWDEVYDKSRAVVGRRYKYIRNDMPEVPYFTYQKYLEQVRPIRPVLWGLYQAGEMTPPQAYVMQSAKPPEELYDLSKDPWETENLVSDPQYSKEIQQLRDELTNWEQDTKDQGRQPEPRSAVGKGVLRQIKNREARIKELQRQ